MEAKLNGMQLQYKQFGMHSFWHISCYSDTAAEMNIWMAQPQ